MKNPHHPRQEPELELEPDPSEASENIEQQREGIPRASAAT